MLTLNATNLVYAGCMPLDDATTQSGYCATLQITDLGTLLERLVHIDLRNSGAVLAHKGPRSFALAAA